jgi:hypothetical protein
MPEEEEETEVEVSCPVCGFIFEVDPDDHYETVCPDCDSIIDV